MREAVNFRYTFTHYLYTLFYTASTEGLPIMRPMWQEFPKDEAMFNVENQFMYGNNILVAPKVGDPANVKNSTDNSWQVNITLPVSACWYSYYSKRY